MNKKFFLAAIRAALENKTVEWDDSITVEEWKRFFQVAFLQNVLPLVANSVFESEVYKRSGRPFLAEIRNCVRHLVVGQIRKTEEFLELYKLLLWNGLQPIVVKGIVCRKLYPNPDNRLSSDEDLYVSEGTFEQCHKLLLESGMEIVARDVPNVNILHEVTYTKKDGALCVELHKELFGTEFEAYANMNEQFENVFDNSVCFDINGVEIRTMNHSMHLLFLIIHIFKHFINSGVGIRQVCDIVMYANAYGSQVDWDFVMEACKVLNADIFAVALFDIGRNYLEFDMDRACYPEQWKTIEIESEDLLDDIIDAGVYGNSDMIRKHSGSITLNAMDSKPGSVLKTMFPSPKVLGNRFHYLQKYPFLVPIAWTSRILKYGQETVSGSKDVNAIESVKLGNQRVELMKKYKIIK